MANALGTLFGDIATAIREKTGDTATMKPAEFPEKIMGIEVGGGSNDVVLLARQDIDGFALNSQFGAFAKDYAGAAPFVLEVGQKYRVLWDGEEVSCTAYSNSALGYPMVCIGDGTQIGGQSKNEPFLIVYTPSANYLTLFAKDDKTTHNVAVYHVVESGGSSADVRYVTFMSDDGTVEYGKLPVATGYDCPNPKFAVTKESTEQYDYNLLGWATTANGAQNANALKAVEEDRTVYANFAAILRYYTITYLDTDGSVLKTESLAYGSMPSYEAKKDNVVFDGWNPSLATVTSNASYTAKWMEIVTFATAAWNKIAEIAASGKASENFAVGDTKEVTLTNGKVLTLEIIAFDHDDLADGSGKAPITLMVKDGTLDTKTTWSTSSKNNYWTTGSVRTKVRGYLDLFPDDLKGMVKSVTKTTHEGRTQSDYSKTKTTSEETLWLPSIAETRLKQDGVTYSDGAQYSHFKTQANQIRYYNGNAVAHMLRSTPFMWNGYAMFISNTGTMGSTATQNPSGYLMFGFCI